MITIVSVGKKHDASVAGVIADYQKRLRAPFDVEWIFVPHSGHDELTARRVESQAIIGMLKSSDYVIVLDERGTEIDSPTLSTRLAHFAAGPRQLVIVIGGAYGVDQPLLERADFVWSLSPLVFPHQLVRLILTEQLYRAQSIQNGSSYHHA